MFASLIQRHSLSRDTVEIACQKDILDSKGRRDTISFRALSTPDETNFQVSNLLRVAESIASTKCVGITTKSESSYEE